MSGVSLLITKSGDDDWNVWIGLPEQDPLLDPYGFIIGSGATKEAAITEAVASLEAATERLQSPAEAIEERAI